MGSVSVVLILGDPSNGIGKLYGGMKLGVIRSMGLIKTVSLY